MMGSEEGEDSVCVCARCSCPIEDAEYVQALEADWHGACFRCSVCNQRLSSWYFERDSQLFCRQDYWTLFGEACQGCAHLIAGPIMVAGEHKYHPDCFVCFRCRVYIGDGERYALVERSKLYCGCCYQSIMGPVLESPKSKVPHTVQLIKIPPTPDGKKNFSVSVTEKARYHAPSVDRDQERVSTHSLCVRNVESPDVLSLQVGDRILEVNGTPVKNQNLEELDRLISQSTQELHLTIEHDPNSRAPSPCPTDDSSYESSGNSTGTLDMKRPCTLNVVKHDGKKSNADSHTGEKTRIRKTSRPERQLSLPMRKHSSVDADSPVSRSCSLKHGTRNHRIFRHSDLIKGHMLGKGFFGQVFKVTHKCTGEVMVVKELVKFDDEAQRSFLKEVKVLRSLDHYHVLKFIGVLYKDKRLSLVTEFISGGTLRSIIKDVDEPLPYTDRINYARDISAAMSYLHSMGIIHRDLNSQNCLVRGENSTVVVADFGLARVMIEDKSDPRVPTFDQSSNHRRSGRKKRYTVVGNPYWMAPEMLKGKQYDEKVDVFSFGIMICELIGRVSADPDYLPRTAEFGLNIPVFKQNFVTSKCPDVLFQVAVKCCELDPDTRPSFDMTENWLKSLSVSYELSIPVTRDLENLNITLSSKKGVCASSLTPL